MDPKTRIQGEVLRGTEIESKKKGIRIAKWLLKIGFQSLFKYVARTHACVLRSLGNCLETEAPERGTVDKPVETFTERKYPRSDKKKQSENHTRSELSNTEGYYGNLGKWKAKKVSQMGRDMTSSFQSNMKRVCKSSVPSLQQEERHTNGKSKTNLGFFRALRS